MRISKFRLSFLLTYILYCVYELVQSIICWGKPWFHELSTNKFVQFLQEAWRNLLVTEYVIDVSGVQMVSFQQKLKNRRALGHV